MSEALHWSITTGCLMPCSILALCWYYLCIGFVVSLKVPSGGLFFPRVCSMLHNTGQSLMDAWMSYCSLAGAVLTPKGGLKMQMVMQMLLLIERQCSVWFSHSILIWKIGNHLPLQDVVRIRDNGWKHLTQSLPKILFLITCFPHHSIYHIV